MRSLRLVPALLLATAACGGDSAVEPAIVAGGGIHDPGIDGVVHVFVIDEDSDQPIAGATVKVGDTEGTTDATGLFTVKDVTGPQTILARAAGHAPAMWIGADGGNVTIPLTTTPTPTTTPPQAQLSGTITGWDALPPPPANHLRIALVTTSQDPEIGNAANEITQPPPVANVPANACVRLPTAGSPACAWRYNTRAGTVALGLVVGDLDTKGTATDTDDVLTITGYAVKQPVSVTAGANQSGLALDLPATGSTTTASIDFGTPPAALTRVSAVGGLELGANGILRVVNADRAHANVVVPSLSLAAGATYELVGIASEPVDDDTAAQSIVIRRGLTSASSLSAGTWLAPPTGLASDRVTASFTRSGGAGPYIMELNTSAGSGKKNRAMSIAILDDSSQVTFPTAFAPLPSGSVLLTVSTLTTASPVDLRDFSVDALVDDATALAGDTIILR